MTLVALGVLAVGCGSGPGVATAVEDDSGIPDSADAPPESDDAPPASADDAPPANPDAPDSGSPGGNPNPGGGLEAVCRQVCDSLGDVNCADVDGDLNEIVAQGCGQQNCLLTDAQRPCEPQFTDLFRCIARVQGLCTDQADQDACDRELSAAATCQLANQPTDNPGPGDCAGTDPCQVCTCAAGANAEVVCASVCM